VIEKTQSAIDKYKAIKQGMLQDLFTRGIDITTGKLRPRYEDAPELYKESKLGWIPNEWDSVEIKNSTHSIMSNVDKHIRENEIEVSLCNYMDVYTNRYLTNQISFSVGSVNAAEYSRFLLQLHDVIITKDSETPDDIAVPSVLIKKIQNLICGYHLCILRSNDLKHLNGEFLMLQLQLPEINRQFAIRANGSTRYGLTIDSIENSYIKIPNEIKEQTEIVLRLHTIDNKLKSEESYLLKLQMLKSGLMSDLLSGRKRVKVAAQE
jgi:type I restriction enzyme S subunit